MGINAIVGSSIFLFPGRLAALLGPASVVAFLLTAVLMVPVALCFAEASSSRDGAGGPALYAQQSFAPTAGFSVGWLCFVTELVSWAAVAAGLAAYAAPFAPATAGGWAGKGLALGSIAALAGVNLCGVKPGARVLNALTAAKLLPLLAIALCGFPLVLHHSPVPLAPHGWASLPRACFLAYFAFQGFEVVPVPAGEATSPGRDAPFAILASLGLAAVLYTLVQASALASVPTLAGSERPLADVGLALFGPLGERLVAAGALVSMLGFTAGCALGGPQYLVALGQQGHLPEALARHHPRTGAPVWAVALTAAGAMVLSLLFDFERLVDFANVVIAAQYLTTSASVVADRRAGRPAAFRAPGGLFVPLAAAAVTLGSGLKGGGCSFSWRGWSWGQGSSCARPSK